MHQSTVDVNDQVAILFVELLEHFSTADYADCRGLKQRFSVNEIQRGDDKFRALAGEFHGSVRERSCPSPWTERIRSIWRLRRTNVWPKCRRFRANPVATRA